MLAQLHSADGLHISQPAPDLWSWLQPTAWNLLNLRLALHDSCNMSIFHILVLASAGRRASLRNVGFSVAMDIQCRPLDLSYSTTAFLLVLRKDNGRSVRRHLL